MGLSNECMEIHEEHTADIPSDVYALIDAEFESLDLMLQKYPEVRASLNVNDIKETVRLLVHSMVSKQVTGSSASRGPNLNHLDAGKNEDFSKNLRIFKSKYMKWTKNFIIKLNGLQRTNNWKWLKVKTIAKVIVALDSEKVH